MDIFEDNPKFTCGLICSLLVAGLVFGGIYMSTSTIEPIEYGLKFNTISKTYDDTEVYTGGWHVIGPFNNFLIFPATVTNIEFASFKGSKTLPL